MNKLLKLNYQDATQTYSFQSYVQNMKKSSAKSSEKVDIVDGHKWLGLIRPLSIVGCGLSESVTFTADCQLQKNPLFLHPGKLHGCVPPRHSVAPSPAFCVAPRPETQQKRIDNVSY